MRARVVKETNKFENDLEFIVRDLWQKRGMEVLMNKTPDVVVLKGEVGLITIGPQPFT